jgi:Fic family protein
MRVIRAGSLEERIQAISALLERTDPERVAEYNYRLEMSWIHHDSAIEGVVYDPGELVAAINDKVVSDSSLIPVYDEIRQHKAAIDLIRKMAAEPISEITLDTIKLLYTTLAPDEAEGKGPPKYRKDMPLHRTYFHEIALPEKIAPGMRDLVKWLADPDNARNMSPVRYASRAHYQMLQIFPFPKHSGKVARLIMNLILLREGYPPVILHATDRQRYYDALRLSADAVANVVQESLNNSVDSAQRYFARVAGIQATA